MRVLPARVVLAAFAALVLPRLAGAQVRVGAEMLRDRSTWRFENPSSFDTAELVPHYFEQHYVLDSVWLTASASYRAGVNWRTTFGGTPERRAIATDYDTFFNPGGVTWVSGTTGDAEMRAFRLAQEMDLGRVGGVNLTAGYRMRVDLADFLEGDRTDTRNGVLTSRTVVTTREYTNAQRHEVFVGGWHQRELTQQWRLRLAGDLAPATVNQLAIRLPDKYPGQTLVYRTATLTTGGRIDLVHAGDGWPLTFSLQADRSWNYRDAGQAGRSSLALGLSLGRGW
jgi:hypothetical protein